MGKKMGAAMPLFLVMSLAMLVMAMITFQFSTTLFVVELVITLASIIIVLIGVFKFKSFASSVLRSTANSMQFSDNSTLSKFRVPMVSANKQGYIIWSNDSFKKTVCEGKTCVGEKLDKFINETALNEMLTSETKNVEHLNKKYTCFGIELNSSYIFYFLEDTYYKEAAEKYELTRPAVATIVFDNREELLRDSDEEQVIHIVAMVENLLQKWASATTGFLKKISGSRFIFITEEKYIKEFIDDKFSILDQIHEIKLNDNYATISMGIGVLGENLKICETWSRKALDMALGRGGDQVAIKNGDSYEFFGGTSKGIAKRDTVRARVIATMLMETVKKSENIFIMGHKFSDLDSVGASVGMWSALVKGQKKETYIVVDDKHTLSKALIESVTAKTEEKIFISPKEAMEIHDDSSLLIVMDTHTPGFLESDELYRMCKRIVVIDHHRMMVNRIKNSLIFYHEPYASSASEMVTELIQYMGEITINRIEAEALLAGMMLDTKNFVLRTGVRTFQAAAFLKSRGADTVEVKRMFSNSIDEYKTRYEIVSQAEIFNSCAVASTDEGNGDIKIVAAQAADELLGILGVKASFVLYPMEDGISISARSFGVINVQLIMEKIGGGGHQTMAGAQLKGVSMADAREKLIEIVRCIEIKDI